MDDMILVSIDDHFIEPPDMYENHVPAKWRDDVPMVVRNESGIDEWVFQGERTSTPFGMAATVGWPREEWGFDPGAYSELRPGCFEVHERVRDMNANGVLASMNFPTMAGPESPEFAWNELREAGCSPEEIDKITWQNACRFFDWDPFAHTPREQATVGALRALARDVDVTRMSREEWRRRNEAAGIRQF